IDIDINNYKKGKADYLKEMAREVADEVSLTKKEKWLSPMPAYERRIVHMELSLRPGVVTESHGEGPERRIVVKPSLNGSTKGKDPS
ncbi:MAG: R3H domain-containing nucleic acid-binding protein, partial [bacterium]